MVGAVRSNGTGHIKWTLSFLPYELIHFSSTQLISFSLQNSTFDAGCQYQSCNVHLSAPVDNIPPGINSFRPGHTCRVHLSIRLPVLPVDYVAK
jgi:hypothetical protein